MRRKPTPTPTKMIGGKKFRLHCTRVVASPLLEQHKLRELGYDTQLEIDSGVFKLWKEVKRE